MIIGITGKTGSGKGVFSRHLQEINPNIVHIDLDKIGHLVLTWKETIHELTLEFGEGILNEEGVIDRKKLAERAFATGVGTRTLQWITWPKILAHVKELMSDETKDYILDGVKLMEAPEIKRICQHLYLIKAPVEIRRVRIMERDHITEEQWLAREDRSPKYQEIEFDFVIINNGRHRHG